MPRSWYSAFSGCLLKSGAWPSSFLHFTAMLCSPKQVCMLSTSLYYLKVPEQSIKQHDWHCHMWFVLPLSPLGKKRGVLFCFGVSFSHIHHHAVLLLLLANAVAFVLGETKLPMKLVQLLRGSCKTEHFHYSLTFQSCLPQQHPSVSRQ